MPDPDPKLRDLATAGRGDPSLTATEWVAAGLSLIWVAAVAAYVYSGSAASGSLGFVLSILVVFLPLALIWTAVTTLRSVRSLRAEAARLGLGRCDAAGLYCAAAGREHAPLGRTQAG